MRPLLRLTWIPLLVLGSACGAPYLSKSDLAPPKTPCALLPDEVCTEVRGSVVVLVDADGNTTPSCVDLSSEQGGRVIWAGEARGDLITALRVRFKETPDGRHPPDPGCTGPFCDFKSPWSEAAEPRAYCYALSLRTASVRTEVKDPKLIIKY